MFGIRRCDLPDRRIVRDIVQMIQFLSLEFRRQGYLYLEQLTETM